MNDPRANFANDATANDANVQIANDARATIASRLLRALRDEQLFEGKLPESALAEVVSEGPGLWLRRQVQEGKLRVSADNLARAVREIDDSVAGLARASQGIRARFADQWRAAEDHTDAFSHLVAALRRRSPDNSTSALLARFEQLVHEGHPRHPGAKTTLGLGEGWRSVLPEQVESFQCRFIAVASESTQLTPVSQNVSTPSVHRALASELPALWRDLVAECGDRGIELAGTATTNTTFHIVPVHPWQWSEVLKPKFAAELAKGTIIELATTVTAEPLMSVRTVRVHDGEGSAHFKLALEAQLTGAIRGISAGAMVGPVASQACDQLLQVDGSVAPRTIEDEPGFYIGRDLAGIRVLHAEDPTFADHQCGAIVREDPARTLAKVLKPNDVVLPIAALQATNPLSGRPVLVDLMRELSSASNNSASPETEPATLVAAWFERLAELLVSPAVHLLARWGLALEPHPQNTVLVLRAGVPHAVVVRDFGGSRVLADGPLATLPTPESAQLGAAIAGTALEASSVEKLVDKVTYPLLVNLWQGLGSCLETLIQYPEFSSITEATYWQPAAATINQLQQRSQFARSAKSEPQLHALSEAVFARITADTLPLKRVLGMRLSGAVTEQDYVPIPNPLVAHGKTQQRAWQAAVARAQEVAHGDVVKRWQESSTAAGVSEVPNDVVLRDIQQATDVLAKTRVRIAARVEQLQRRVALHGAGLGAGLGAGADAGATEYWDLIAQYPTGLRSALVDSLTSEGHTVHPLAKLRRGFTDDESAVYGPENGQPVELRLVAVEKRLLLGAPEQGEIGRQLAQYYPHHAALAWAELQRGSGVSAADSAAGDPALPELNFELLIVHPWQWEHIISVDFASEIADGHVRLISSCSLAALPSISLRTMIPLQPAVIANEDNRRKQRPYVKVALDVVLTSTRRSISQDSALGTPAVANLVAKLVGEFALDGRVISLREVAGAAFRDDADPTADPTADDAETATTHADPEAHYRRVRGLSTLWRESFESAEGTPGIEGTAGIEGTTTEGIELKEIAVSACAVRGLPPEVRTTTGSPLQALIENDPHFLRKYCQDLLHATLPVMWRYGIAIESHLQNTMIRVAWQETSSGASSSGKSSFGKSSSGTPSAAKLAHRTPHYCGIVLRDFSGLRIYEPRLREAGHEAPARRGAVTVTQDLEVFLNKGHYANFHANISGLVDEISHTTGQSSESLWSTVREVVAEVIASYGRDAIPAEDLDALMQPTLRQKDFVTMALHPDSGDRYYLVPNPVYPIEI